eukprot:CAMPEP_0197049326 /NCGR_PEP_ID=MMETSP1384-20130603/24499_1 /TAXON_ID=29189 /ORGANISM="Ammonia sp." /LENGTH=87 /DNA_ID=CAMNT_0042481587 /DNA_START=25 /DNA_END=285 /DNA_ORIENTATION=+
MNALNPELASCSLSVSWSSSSWLLCVVELESSATDPSAIGDLVGLTITDCSVGSAVVGASDGFVLGMTADWFVGDVNKSTEGASLGD